MKNFVTLCIGLMVCMCSAFGQTDSLKVGLMAQYPLGSDARDISGNDKNGTLFSSEPAQDRNGADAKATHFKSKNNVIGKLDTRLNLNATVVPTLTVVFWAKFDQLSSRFPIMDMGDKDKFRSLTIERDDENVLWRLGCGSKGEIMGPRITAEWTFVAVVYDQANDAARLVINDEVFASRAKIKSNKNTTVFGGFAGTIDEVMIYNRVLTLSEIESLSGLMIKEGAGDYAIEVKVDYKIEKAIRQEAELDSLRSRIVVASELSIYDAATNKSKIDFLVSGDSLRIVQMLDDRAIVEFKGGKSGSVRLDALYDYTRSVSESGLQRRISISLQELFDFTKLSSWIIVGLLLVLLVLAFRFFYQIDDFFMRMKKDKLTQASGGKADATVVEHKPSVLSRVFPLTRFRKWPLYMGAIIATLVLASMIWDKHEAEWFLNQGISIIPNHYDVLVHWVLWGGMVLILLMFVTLLLESFTIAGPLGGGLRVVYLLLVNFIMLVVTFYLFILVLVILAVMFGLFLLSSLGGGTKYRCTRCGRVFYGSSCPNCG